MKRLIGLNLVVALAAAFAVLGAAEKTEARTRLSGAGASFPSKIYQRWFADFAKEGGHRVNYQAVGSGSGRKAFLDETVDFGASDDPMKQGDIAKAKRGMVQIPMTGGTIAFGYNNPSCDLKLTQEQAVQVAIGEINNWSQVGCDEQPMTWVYRSDGSGTTAAFTNSMKAFSKKWKLGTGKSVAWPVGIGNKGNAGVAGSIRTTLGSIGYVNQSYVKGEIRAATLQNKNGDFVAPSVESGSLALNGITLDENLAGTDPNPTAEGAYPIATLTWVLAYETGNGRKTEAVKETLSKLLTDNYQEKASVLGYVPLRGDILEKSRAAVERIGK
jgi:phosphate transport system substrate-binding protein